MDVTQVEALDDLQGDFQGQCTENILLKRPLVDALLDIPPFIEVEMVDDPVICGASS